MITILDISPLRKNSCNSEVVVFSVLEKLLPPKNWKPIMRAMTTPYIHHELKRGFLGVFGLFSFAIFLRIVAALHHRYLGISPKSFNVVEFPDVFLKYMNHHIYVVHQYPFCVL